MSIVSLYAENQRAVYSRISSTLADAREAVGPNYDKIRREAVSYAKLMLAQYQIRKMQYLHPATAGEDISKLRVLDFACGIGRVMEAIREVGVGTVDGCDISAEMLQHAKTSPLLNDSKFFLSSGEDAGDAPEEHYDIACSFLCFHHISVRQTRIRILESLCRKLKPGGMVFIEFKMFPGATPGRIPANHAHWTENRPSKDTNSAADVWVTPDSLGEAVQDFRLFFSDLATQEIDLSNDLYNYDPNAIYQLGYNELFITGVKGRGLRKQLTGTDE